jgi:hypothetical protein
MLPRIAVSTECLKLSWSRISSAGWYCYARLWEGQTGKHKPFSKSCFEPTQNTNKFKPEVRSTEVMSTWSEMFWSGIPDVSFYYTVLCYRFTSDGVGYGTQKCNRMNAVLRKDGTWVVRKVSTNPRGAHSFSNINWTYRLPSSFNLITDSKYNPFGPSYQLILYC